MGGNSNEIEDTGYSSYVSLMAYKLENHLRTTDSSKSVTETIAVSSYHFLACLVYCYVLLGYLQVTAAMVYQPSFTRVLQESTISSLILQDPWYLGHNV